MRSRNVRNIFFNCLVFLSFIFLFSGCQKAPINGNLDGEWEVVEVYPTPPKWENTTRFFYNFQLHVCQLTTFGMPFTNGNLIYTSDSMTLYFPYINTPENELILKQYGIFTNPVTFNVEFESKSRLILSNDDSTVILKKF